MTDDADALPEVNSETEAWWAATREHQLLVQRCRSCSRFQHYPRSLCIQCSSTDLEFVRASGAGRVYSYTVVNRAPSAAFKPPYVVALVRLEEGPVLLTHLVELGSRDARCEMPVEVRWSPLSDGRHLPVFRPADGG